MVDELTEQFQDLHEFQAALTASDVVQSTISTVQFELNNQKTATETLVLAAQATAQAIGERPPAFFASSSVCLVFVVVVRSASDCHSHRYLLNVDAQMVNIQASVQSEVESYKAPVCFPFVVLLLPRFGAFIICCV